MSGPGDLEVTPDPVLEGRGVSVRYRGKKLYYSVDGGAWQSLDLDAEGSTTVKAPIGSSYLAFSDFDGNEAIVEVVHSTPSHGVGKSP